MSSLEQYRAMLKELADIRHKHKFNNSKEEDLHLEKMDVHWKTMSKRDQEIMWEMQKALPLQTP